MLDYTQLACPVCGRPMRKTDDVVVCPQCGAPHHRSCWQRIGRCAYADRHGTPEQWKPPITREDEDALICGNCGEPNEPGASVCAKCGHTLSQPEPSPPSEQPLPVDEATFYSQFSPYIGIAPDSSMDGEPVMDVAAYVGPNAGYYLSRFFFMRVQKTRSSWNWAAALFPVEWLLYRKMKGAALAAAIIAAILLLPYLYLAGLLLQRLSADPALVQGLLQGNLPALALPGWLTVSIDLSALASFLLRLFMGLKSNRFYDGKVFRDIRLIRAGCSDPLRFRYTLSRRGGVSRAAVVVYICAALLLMAAAVYGLGTLL